MRQTKEYMNSRSERDGMMISAELIVIMYLDLSETHQKDTENVCLVEFQPSGRISNFRAKAPQRAIYQI